MAFPQVVTRGSARTTASNTTTHAITLPAHQAGDRLVVHFASDGGATTSVNTGSSSADWEKLGQASNGTTVSGSIFTKVAAGASETLTLTTSASEQSSHTVLVIRPTAGYTTGIVGTNANGSSTNSNPPNLAPAAGTQDYLWIATRAGDSTVVATVAPADFTNLQTQAAAGTGGASSNTAERSLNASSLDPGTFTSVTEQWVSWTLAVWEFLPPQTLTQATRADNDQTFYAATAAPGQVALTQSARLDGTQAFYAATVTATIGLEAARVDNAQSFYAPTVTQASNPAQSLTPARFDGAQSFYAATVQRGTLTPQQIELDGQGLALNGQPLQLLVFVPDGGGQTLTAVRYDNAQTFYASAVSVGQVTLAPARYDAGQTFFSATVTQGGAPQTLTPARFDNAQTFYAPSVAVGQASLSPARFDNGQTFYAPSVSVGAVNLSAARLDNEQQFFASIVTVEGGPQFILPPLLTNEQTFFGAAVGDGDGVSHGFQIVDFEPHLWWKRKPKAIDAVEAARKIEEVARKVEAAAARVIKPGRKVERITPKMREEVRQAIAPMVKEMPGFDWKPLTQLILVQLIEKAKRDRIEQARIEQEHAEIAAILEIERICRMRDDDDVIALLLDM